MITKEPDLLKGICHGEEVSIPRNRVRKVSELGFVGWNKIFAMDYTWELMVFGFLTDLTFTFPSSNIGPYKLTYTQ